MTQRQQDNQDTIRQFCKKQGACAGANASSEMWGRLTSQLTGITFTLGALGLDALADECRQLFQDAADKADKEAA